MTAMDFGKGMTEKIIPCSGAGGGEGPCSGETIGVEKRCSSEMIGVEARSSCSDEVDPRRRRRSSSVGNRSHGVVIVDMTIDVIGCLNSCGAIVGTSIPIDLSRGGATIVGTGAGAGSGFDVGGDGSGFYDLPCSGAGGGEGPCSGETIGVEKRCSSEMIGVEARCSCSDEVDPRWRRRRSSSVGNRSHSVVIVDMTGLG